MSKYEKKIVDKSVQIKGEKKENNFLTLKDRNNKLPEILCVLYNAK